MSLGGCLFPELPYFPFYGSDWLGDSKVRRMSLEARAVHLELLCHSWNIGPIPAGEPRVVAHLLGLSQKKFEALWQQIAPCWQQEGGDWWSPRLEKVRAKQKGKRKGGKAGGEAKQNGSKTEAKPKLQSSEFKVQKKKNYEAGAD